MWIHASTFWRPPSHFRRPSPPGHHRTPGWAPTSDSGFPPAVCFTCAGVCSSVSHSLLPHLSPQVFPVCLHLCSCPANWFINIYFSSFQIYVFICNICFSDLLHSVSLPLTQFCSLLWRIYFIFVCVYICVCVYIHVHICMYKSICVMCILYCNVEEKILFFIEC